MGNDRAITHRIDSLTSLRFIAASMIVVHHSRGMLWLTPEFLNKIPLDQAVSFFFVLSGFILTYNYSQFGRLHSVIQFYVARFARIWPLHVCSFFTLFILFFPYSLDLIKTHPNNYEAILNILMIQGWIPIKRIYLSYNWLSWAVSTEVFFYLLFPFLIKDFESTYKHKLFGSLSLTFLLITFCNYTSLPSDGLVSPDNISRTGLLYINPLSRLFEFVLGMSTAFIWHKYNDRISLNGFSGSLLEICILSGVIASLYFAISFIDEIVGKYIGPAGCEYLCHTSSAILFAALIFVMSIQMGILSKILRHKGLVLLGEASFAIFIFHQIILRCYSAHAEWFSHLPEPLLYAIFWVFLILFSLGILYFVERPSQRFIMNVYKKFSYSQMR